MPRIRRSTLIGGVSAAALRVGRSRARRRSTIPAPRDTEIKLGHTNPYSGPLSAYGVIGQAIKAYWNKVNDEGGINGRKINFITYDDGYDAAKTVEMVRKLVEEDQVLATFHLLGTPTNTAIHKYLNRRRCRSSSSPPARRSGASPKNFPWTMGWQPDYATEGADLRQAHPGRGQGSEDRHPVAERR